MTSAVDGINDTTARLESFFSFISVENHGRIVLETTSNPMPPSHWHLVLHHATNTTTKFSHHSTRDIRAWMLEFDFLSPKSIRTYHTKMAFSFPNHIHWSRGSLSTCGCLQTAFFPGSGAAHNAYISQFGLVRPQGCRYNATSHFQNLTHSITAYFFFCFLLLS
jgi:hypothetical protein